MQAMDNTLVNDSMWDSWLDLTPTSNQPSFSPFQPVNGNMKRPLEVDTQDFPPSKRHAGAVQASNFTTPVMPSASLTAFSTTVETLPTPSSSNPEVVGLSDAAADFCATWFSKFGKLPK